MTKPYRILSKPSSSLISCPDCGYPHQHFDEDGFPNCPLCAGQWESWELQFSPLPQPHIRDQIAAWLSRLPEPTVLELAATDAGLKVRLFAPPQAARGVVEAWAALTSQQSRWKRVEVPLLKEESHTYQWGLRSDALIPTLTNQEGDLFLATAGQLMGMRPETEDGRQETDARSSVPRPPPTNEVCLRVWLLGKETKVQERLTALAAYHYGTETGVEDDTPNPWSLRLSLLRFVMLCGGIVAALSGGLLTAGWAPLMGGLLGVLAGGLLFIVGYLGLLQWLRWRSLPKPVVERAITGALLKVAFTLHGTGQPERLDLLSGESTWTPLKTPWPVVKTLSMPVPAADLAGLVSPPEGGEGTGIIARESRQDVPAPPPAPALVSAPFKIGQAVATQELIGIDPDGHGMATGGSRTGKTSFVFRMLKQLIAQGEEAPGIFLVDPHVSLADGFLHTIDLLPPAQREIAIQRLRVISPDQPEVVPLNLLMVPDFSWAGNAIVQAGNRIWDDYWGPRMQAALLGLFRLAHAWNMQEGEEQKHKMGLLHTVFAAFNADWRHDALSFLKPADRLGSLALDALLGQSEGEGGSWNQKWATEVISPVLSKAMALELSPWLFSAMHQDRFVDMDRWVREKAWIVLRLPAGEMGREGARLMAGMIYNVFEAAFRKATSFSPESFYFIIDEAQEIAGGMRIESMLSEGAKFGARMFVLAQSLSLLRRVEGFDAVVQSLLANTSTQAFFAPDPEDADLMRATLSATVRYGDTTLDIPSLHCWLRARLDGRWQPPTLAQIEPLIRAEPERVQRVIRETISAHREDYAPADLWQQNVVQAMLEIVPQNTQGLLSEFLRPRRKEQRQDNHISEKQIQLRKELENLGW